MTEVEDPLNHDLNFSYDFARRLTTYTFDDETTNLVSPVLVQGLADVGGGTGTFGNPSPLFAPSVAVGSFTDALDRVTEFTTDRWGLPTSITDPMENVTTIERNSAGYVTRITRPDPDGAGPLGEQVWEFTYDADFNLLTQTLPDESEQVWTYNAAYSVPESFTDEEGRLTVYEIDTGNGNVLSITRDTAATEFTYTAAPEAADDLPGGLELTLTDAEGVVTEYVYEDDDEDADFGRLMQIIYASGSGDEIDIDFEYDTAGNLTAQVNPLSRRTEHVYDNLGRRTGSTLADPDGGGQTSPEFFHEYDAAGRTVSTTDPLNNETQYLYDTLNRLVKIIYPDPDGGGGQASPEVVYDYDDAGQLVLSIDEMDRETAFEYDDDLGRLETQTLPDPDGEGGASAPVWSYTYYVNGLKKTVTDPLSHTTDYQYNIRDWMISVKQHDPDGGGALGRPETTVDFDLVGNRLSSIDPVGNETTWVYDDFNRVTEETNELADTRLFEYDLVGNLTERTDRNGRVTEYDYNDLYQRTAERWKDGESTVKTITFAWNDAGDMTDAYDDVSDYAYTRDNLGRIVAETASLLGPSIDVQFTTVYNAANSRTELAAQVDNGGGYEADFLNAYTYDNLQWLTRLDQTGDGGNAVAEKRVDFAYNAAGQFTTITRYLDTAGGGGNIVAVTENEYDGIGRLASSRHADQSDTTIADYAWAYDAASRITQQDFTADVGDDGVSDFEYDATNQLIDADHDFQSDEAYEYDENGNRTVSGYTTGDNNQLTSDGTWNYTYDDEGNRLTQTRISSASVPDKTIEYTWDHRNRLTTLVTKNNGGTITKQVDYTYDVFDRRIAKSIDLDGTGGNDPVDEHFIYDGQHVALRLDANAAIPADRGWRRLATGRR